MDSFLIAPESTVSLAGHDPGFTGKFRNKEDAASKLEKDLLALEKLQTLLYAHDDYAVLVIIQAMDAAGKDSVIKHVMSGVNPQGVTVTSFKTPSAAELDHDLLWRHVTALPRRGMIGIFNRSYYEEVLIVRVHPEALDRERLPAPLRGEHLWKHRFEDINCFERYLTRNGIAVVKFFLNVSRKEQKKRFLERIDLPEKNWKFAIGDLEERARWPDYMKAYEEMLSRTSTAWAPWYVIPADHKWFTRAAVADILVEQLRALELDPPPPEPSRLEDLARAREQLEREGEGR
jgi:PPK2 family polyphosphate:nucleotide phosphotransferase